MNKKVLMMDAFSTLHVGNGALIDNTYKLCKKYLASNVEISTIDIIPNIDRFPIVHEDLFSNYGGSGIEKLFFSIKLFLFYIVECINIKVFSSKLRFPWPRQYRRFLDSVDECDVCVSLSGETINDYYYPHMYLRLLTYYLAILKGKDMILFPQSIGPIFKPLSIRLLRKVFGKSKFIIARDELSLKVANDLWGSYPVKVLFSPDVAVTQESELVVPHEFNFGEKKIIGVTVSDIPKAEMNVKTDYLTSLTNGIVSTFDKEKFAILLMPSNYKHTGFSGDYKYCLKAKDIFEKKGFSVNILKNEIIHPEQYQGIQKSLHAFISTRMHVGILSSSAGIPTLMINTQHKIKAYMDLMSMSDYVVELKDLPNDIERTLASLDKNNDKIRINLKKNNLKLRAMLDECLSQIT